LPGATTLAKATRNNQNVSEKKREPSDEKQTMGDFHRAATGDLVFC
jgi:hypothetical protein